MPVLHIGDNICEYVQSIVDEWEIPPSKISATLTDNGSNMIATSRPQVMESDDDNLSDAEGDDQDMESGEDADLSSLVLQLRVRL